MALAKLLFPIALAFCLSPVVSAATGAVEPVLGESIVKDAGVGLSRAELEQIISRWSAEMRQAAADDYGDRLELLNMALVNKKLALMADQMTPEKNGEAYWALYFQLQGRKRQATIEEFLANLDIPELTKLTKERYTTEKERFAKVPEQRLTSHILFFCPPGQCDRTDLRPVAEEVLVLLRGGADFEQLVAEYSQDPGSKDKGGRYDTWFSLGQKDVEPRYTGGAFEIAEVGGYSDLVETKFGIHIIRLDDVRETYFKTYDEVRDTIARTLRTEFVKQSVQEFEASLSISDEAYIDGAVLDELLAPYKTARQ